MKKARTVALLEPKQLEGLRELSAKTGATICELIRRAVAAYLKGTQP